jgi:Family of unknown function (DUF6524)
MDIQIVTPKAPWCRIAQGATPRDEAGHMEKLNLSGFLLRFVAACALVLATFNPSGHSYAHWVAGVFPHIGPLQAVAGLALLIAWIVYLSATMRSLGLLGVVLAAAFFAALVWLFVSWGWISLSNTGALTWIALLLLSLVLAAGMSWSHIRRRLTGQADVDEVDAR